MILNLGLSNGVLYSGLVVERLAGKLTLVTSPAEAIPLIAANVMAMAIDPDEVVLTGAMAVWTYLVVFHLLHGRTRRIYYEDGRGERLLIAAHG